jgi:hypothetical protein
MQQDTWTISEVHGSETVEVAAHASHDEALRAINLAMYGSADVMSGAWTDPVHEHQLAA